MSKKQTAVEWLESEFIKLESTTGVHGIMYDLIEQAKEMEKEQINKACYDGYYQEGMYDVRQYYNETFKAK